jgi:coenzyme Q-binding protein COQ10
MVGDVAKYPDYIPWFTFMHVSNVTHLDDSRVRFDAEAGVGFKFLSERFTTRITRNKSAQTIDVILLKGPFKRLNCQWKFTDDPKGARVDFDIDFEFKNPFLEGFLKANFDKAVSRLMACFEGRAATLYPKAV